MTQLTQSSEVPVRGDRHPGPPSAPVRRVRRQWPWLNAAAALLAGAVAVVVAAEPAAALPKPMTGLVRRGASSSYNSLPTKTITADCPEGKQIVGGGGTLYGESTAVLSRVALTQLEPYGGSGTQGFIVSAAEIAGGTTGDWMVDAQAICADPVPGHHIVGHNSTMSSSPSRGTQATCPDGERVLGTGARIQPANLGDAYKPGIGLQGVAAADSGDRALAVAHEQPSGYAYDWRLRAIAICADPPLYYSVRNADSATDSALRHIASVECPRVRDPRNPSNIRGTARTNAGATVLPFASVGGNVTLDRSFQDPVRQQGAVATAYENTPTSAQWRVRAQAICVI